MPTYSNRTFNVTENLSLETHNFVKISYDANNYILFLAIYNWIHIGVSKCVNNTGLYKYSITNVHDKVIV